MELDTETIGTIDNGCDGHELYIRVKRFDDSFDADSLEQIHTAMLARFYRDTSVPGGYFCHTVDVKQLADNIALVIVYGQYDN